MSKEDTKFRVAAGKYARDFLVMKYRLEYQELYRAYLINRGISVRDIKSIVDERELLQEKAGE